jgi:hypothetical protein
MSSPPPEMGGAAAAHDVAGLGAARPAGRGEGGQEGEGSECGAADHGSLLKWSSWKLFLECCVR